jgi:hypothetical protein
MYVCPQYFLVLILILIRLRPRGSEVSTATGLLESVRHHLSDVLWITFLSWWKDHPFAMYRIGINIGMVERMVGQLIVKRECRRICSNQKNVIFIGNGD